MPIVVFDTEYLTDEGVMERRWGGIYDVPPLLVQLAAYKLEIVDDDLVITDDLFLLSKPRDAHGKEIIPSAYFTRLTGISYEQIQKNGLEFSDVLNKFLVFIGNDTIAYSYGNDFIRPIMYSCFYSGVKLDFPANMARDVRRIFCLSGLTEEEVYRQTSGSIAKYLGINIDAKFGHIHDARFDALSIIEALHFLIRSGRLSQKMLIEE